MQGPRTGIRYKLHQRAKDAPSAQPPDEASVKSPTKRKNRPTPLLAARKRPGGIASLVAAAAMVAASIPVYMGVPGMFEGDHVVSLALFIAAALLLLVQALRWNNSDGARLATVLLMVIIFQAVLGMWTVIWLVKPVIVMAHLLGGLLTLSMLTWLAFKTTPGSALVLAEAPRLRRLLWIGLGLLVVQIALGGWTSANYAALACGTDFPTCLGQWWPEQDYREGFVLWRGIGVDYEGGVLDGAARVAIQMSHRIMALLVVGHLLVVGLRMLRTPGLVFWGSVLLVLLFRHQIIAMYSPDPAVVALGSTLMLFAAFYQLTDAMQTVASGALRGYKITTLPMAIHIVSFWGLGLGLGMVLGLTDWLLPRLGVHGFWAALVVSLSVAGLTLVGYLSHISRQRLHRQTL